MPLLIMYAQIIRSQFTFSLDKTLLQTYAELLERAYKYMCADEGVSDRRQTEGKG